MKNESVDTFVCYAYKPEPYKPAENDVEEDLRRYFIAVLKEYIENQKGV